MVMEADKIEVEKKDLELYELKEVDVVDLQINRHFKPIFLKDASINGIMKAFNDFLCKTQPDVSIEKDSARQP
ncbi:hypothetical protein [Brevibacillus sp. H7]|uniref:hypothetical protein n=1 Tax=Brevibacillus sp. H7 TaxID=3349138 RepID=UPI0038249FDD